MVDDRSGRVQGPASDFPSIERKNGRPIDEWQTLIRASDLNMELVTWLKTEYGMGHGHNSALVAYTLAGATDAGA